MEIKVNDYVRTDKGTIDKITDENIMTYQVALMGFGEKPIKSSPRIIDLIEVGDYVNGYKVVDKGKYEFDGNQSYIVIDFDTDNDELHWGDVIEVTNDEIKSVLTKEMFEQMEYKID